MTAVAPEPHRVAWREHETADAVTLGMIPHSGRRAAFAAGQFNMLYAFAVGEVAISISGSPIEEGPLIHTIRDVGAVSHALTSLQVGDTLGVRGPFGTGWGLESARGRDLVVVAGGIGLAPLRGAIDQVIGQRSRFGNVEIVIGARTAADLAFRADIEAWRRRGDIEVHVTVDRATDDWRGTVGVVTAVLPRLRIDPAAIAMICGPEVMMRFTAAALLEKGLAAANIRVSMERNMQCATAQCGHCQFGSAFICADGPVLPWERVAPLLAVREL